MAILKGHVRVRLVDSIKYKSLGVITCPMPRDGDWIVRGKKLYRVHSIWLFDKKPPLVVLTLFDFSPPPQMMEYQNG